MQPASTKAQTDMLQAHMHAADPARADPCPCRRCPSGALLRDGSLRPRTDSRGFQRCNRALCTEGVTSAASVFACSRTLALGRALNKFGGEGYLGYSTPYVPDSFRAGIVMNTLSHVRSRTTCKHRGGRVPQHKLWDCARRHARVRACTRHAHWCPSPNTSTQVPRLAKPFVIVPSLSHQAAGRSPDPGRSGS